MATGRWHSGLIDDSQDFSVLWRPAEPAKPPRLLPAEERAVTALITACELLGRRGPDPQAWATPFRQNPIAFLLDTTSDPVNVWGPDGTLVYSNRAAEKNKLDTEVRHDTAAETFVGAGSRFERRCTRFECVGIDYVLEVFREVRR
jgi:hypothetical protein